MQPLSVIFFIKLCFFADETSCQRILMSIARNQCFYLGLTRKLAISYTIKFKEYIILDWSTE